MTDPSNIAAKLTEPQRRAILAGSVREGRGYWPLYNTLVDKGLVAGRGGGSLTPLGLAVRALISED